MYGERAISRENVERLTQLLISGEALHWIREFEAYRSGLANVDEHDRPDKRTTIFVDAADLVWAWISEPGEKGFRSYAQELITRELEQETTKPQIAPSWQPCGRNRRWLSCLRSWTNGSLITRHSSGWLMGTAELFAVSKPPLDVTNIISVG
ncbi:hypothetical protein O7746_04135 [Corynebacterium pseudotuberculosis]|nr:hypothetical protein [Corynebacterium pseudotuberculosis]WFP66806.1 hypothetical protein P8128_08595 [Corynebacterium pseudotuberculosis]